MKLSYILPVYNTSDITPFIKSIVDSEFFKNNECSELIICLDKKDTLPNEVVELLQNVNTILLKADKKFNFNDSFYSSIEHTSGDAVVLLDSKLKNTPALVLKYLKKYESGAKIVFVKKKREKVKGFFAKIFEKIYNFFISIYTSKKDKCNIISMGLISRDIIEILSVIPQRRCSLKNTDDLYKTKTATIYVNPNIPCEKVDFGHKTLSKTTCIISTILTIVLIPVAIILGIFVKSFAVNFLAILAIILSMITAILSLPKHIYDCRNKNLNNVKFSLTNIQKDK